MDNPAFVDEETIGMVHQDEDCDDYNIPNTSRVDETSFREPATTEATSTLRLNQKVKRDKLAALYRHLKVTGNLDLIDLNQFKLMIDPKKGATIFEFYSGNRWAPFTKQTGEFFAPKAIRYRFGEVNTMKNFLGIDRTPPALERSLSAASKLKAELPTDLETESIPLEELSPLVKDIHVKTREASQNTGLDIREFLGIDKALQSIQGELLNNTSELTRINIQRDTKKLEEVENDPTYTDEQTQLYRDRLDDLYSEKRARLEILTQNRKDLQAQVARIKQTLEKFLNQNTSLAKRICILFCEQGIAIFTILTAFSMTTSTIVLTITCFFWKRGRRLCTKRRKDLEKMARQASRCTQKTCRKSH